MEGALGEVAVSGVGQVPEALGVCGLDDCCFFKAAVP